MYVDRISMELQILYFKVLQVEPGLKLRVYTKKINFPISQPKHMLWELKRTVSMRRFF